MTSPLADGANSPEYWQFEQRTCIGVAPQTHSTAVSPGTPPQSRRTDAGNARNGRTTEFSSGAGTDSSTARKAVMPAPSGATAGSASYFTNPANRSSALVD